MWLLLWNALLANWITVAHAGDESIVRFVSLRPNLDVRQLEYLDFHTNILRRRSQIEQTTGHMLHVINQKRFIGLQVMPSGPIHYSKTHPDWTYEAYLVMVGADFLRIAVPGDPFYRYLFSEVLSRQGEQRIPDALGQINLAVLLNSTEPLYREKRISLFILGGQANSAVDDVRWLRQQMDLYLRDKYCSYCTRKRVKKAIHPLAWRHWFTLALYDLATHNSTQAEWDLTVALDLASAAIYANQSEIAASVTSVIRHLKAVALHNNGKFQEAMNLAILNAHTDPSTLDAVLLVAQTLARTALYDRSLSMLNLALPLLDIFTVEPSSASSLVQIFTEVSLVKRMFYQLRAWIYYRLGNVVESEENAEVCLELLPSDALCSYVLSISKLVTGRFVDAVKAAAPVLSQWTEPEVFKSAEFIHLSYLKAGLQGTTRDQFRITQIFSIEFVYFVASPKRLKSILFDSTVFIEGHSARVGIYPVRSVNRSEECSGSWTLGLLHSGPCQSLRLKRLGQFLCQLDSTFYLFLPSAPVDSSPTVAPFNQRHRVSIALAALHSAESIRNYWCERRRVSFGTCWSYSPNQNDPQLSQRTTTFARNSKLDDWTSWSSPYCTRPTNPTASSNTHQHCRSPNSGGPDWLVHTSATARFLQLADPSGAPTFWHSDQETSTGGKEFSTDSGDSSDSSFTSGRTFFDDFLHQRPATGFSGECYDASRFKSSTNGNSGHCENEWRTAAVRDQRFFILHSQIVPDTLPYVPAAFRILSSVFRIRALLNPDGTGILDDSLADTDIFGDLPSHFPHYPRSHDDLDNRSSQANTLEMILSYLDHLWTEAGERDLFDRNHRVALNLFVPGRVDLARSGTSDLSSHRYLAGVLLFEKDINKNYMLSILVLSNAQHRHELGAELDAAFEEFLVHGEKALASILAGSNSQTGTRRLTSPFEDHYLQDAVNSAFHWLYYWIILKPIESVYSFHVGFGLVLGMLRALGVEPKSSIPVAERSLELEALFVGSPESFASVCRSLLNLSWLSYSSLTLTWQVAPETLIQHPKMFMELLNLQAASECSLQ
ncbi:hypothetical protein FGIG_00007 [Fasciola gigantica]|uniref:Tetratricopeptide repeat protein 13 n=1 Tax=Fasciola gigantica TaxID=46835 RepID=A0A504YR59_FASGI|nr:hypothetical protein FGIG_00007 [Fasciola gigantica]